tara:strand:- start:671 stop:1387 length:717 start_codon:yes stop_codon:yes gene_type:complete
MFLFGSKTAQKGNVLFLILIAVALFAALSYAVTNSTRSAGNADREIDKTKAAEVIQHAINISSAMQKLILINGCDYDAIDNNVAFGDPATNPGLCNIYDPVNGGGIPYNQYPDDTASIFSNSTNAPGPGKKIRIFNRMKVVNVGINTRNDILIHYFNINESLCKGINNLAKIEGEVMQENSPYEGGWSNPINTGSSMPSSLVIGDAATNLVGKNFGCYKADRAGKDMGYHAYYVLIER